MNKELITTYLSKLGDVPLLNKEQEIVIAKRLEKAILEMLLTCANFQPFLKDIQKMQEKFESPAYLVKITKRIEENSTQDIIQLFILDFEKLSESIDIYLSNPNRANRKKVIRNLRKVELTNSTITNMIRPFIELYSEVAVNNKKTLKNYKLLNITSKSEYENLLSLVVNSEEGKFIFAKSIDIKVNDLLYILKSQESIENYYIENNITNTDGLLATGKKLKKVEKQVESIRNELITANLRLVVSRIKHCLNQGLDVDDLIQEGNIGLMKAIDKFDYKKGFKFSTYATWWIDQTMKRAIANTSNIIRVPVHVQEIMQKMERAKSELNSQGVRNPSDAEILEVADLTQKQLNKVKDYVQQPLSLEFSIGEDMLLRDILVDNKEESDPSQTLLKEKQAENVREVLSKLKPKYEKVLRLRHGIGEKSEHVLSDIGTLLGISRVRVSQIEKLALREVSKKINPKIKKRLTK